MNYCYEQFLVHCASLFFFFGWATSLVATSPAKNETVAHKRILTSLPQEVGFTKIELQTHKKKYSPDKTRFAHLENGLIKIVDAKTNDVVRQIKPQARFGEEPQANFWFSPCGTNLILVSGYAVDIFTIERGCYSATFSEHCVGIVAAAVNKARNRVFTIDEDGVAFVTEIPSANQTSLNILATQGFESTFSVHRDQDTILIHTQSNDYTIDLSTTEPTFVEK